MKSLTVASCILAFALIAGAQTAVPGAPASSTQNPTVSGAGQIHKEQNAQSATQDTTATTGDQVSKPAGAKESTVIGCLGGPDADGHLMLNSMQFRSGVEVMGPVNLKEAAGQKVKLTGHWVPGSGTEADSTQKQQRKFQATTFDVLAEKCPAPAETTPISKKKQKQQKAAAKAASSSNPQ